MTILRNTRTIHRAPAPTAPQEWDELEIMDLPMLETGSDALEDDLWFNQWANDLPRRFAEDSSPIYCE